ncbi:MAG: hypothetical protein HQ581_12790 [Planctomycetes bacterium]|nr:hypothetical protein [Planctomycetota bacterium]
MNHRALTVGALVAVLSGARCCGPRKPKRRRFPRFPQLPPKHGHWSKPWLSWRETGSTPITAALTFLKDGLRAVLTIQRK